MCYISSSQCSFLNTIQDAAIYTYITIPILYKTTSVLKGLLLYCYILLNCLIIVVIIQSVYIKVVIVLLCILL